MAGTQSVAPPPWAEAWLRSWLLTRDRETVSGDLLEEYRERIRPHRAPRAELTTLMTASVLLVLGASSTLRTQSVSAGAITTFSVLVLSAALCMIGNALLLA